MLRHLRRSKNDEPTLQGVLVLLDKVKTNQFCSPALIYERQLETTMSAFNLPPPPLTVQPHVSASSAGRRTTTEPRVL